MKPEDFPLKISSGETISDPEALAKCIRTNTARANGNTRAALAAQNILERIKTKAGNGLN